LIKLIFYSDGGKEDQKTKAKHEDLLVRKRVEIKSWKHLFCKGNKKMKKLLTKGEDSIAREFDVVRYIKLQKRVKALFDALLT
jgi:hypothetical protein